MRLDVAQGASGAAAGRTSQPASPPASPLVADLRARRLAEPPPGAPGGAPTGAAYRERLAGAVDEALAELWTAALGSVRAGAHAVPVGRDGVAAGVALGVVGSLARRDAGPASDLDLVVLHDGHALTPAALAALADALWYPLWDAGLDLDHAVRSLAECRTVASADLPAAVGLLDLRCVAGDPSVVHRAVTVILADWRSAARKRMPDLVRSIESRARRFRELAHRTEPDLKDARGGLRDLVVTRALAASWLTDRPHGALDTAGDLLLDARDALARATGRPGTRLLRAEQEEVAAALGFTGTDAPDELLAALAGAARTVSHGLDVTLRHARQALAAPGRQRPIVVRGRTRPPRLRSVGDGLVEHSGEVVLGIDVDPTSDPVLPLRAAVAAARERLPISPVTLDSLAACPPLPHPWPPEARAALGDLLGSGIEQIRVFEELDLAGVVGGWFPGWVDVRNRPQRSAIHEWTVDRHLVTTSAFAAELLAGRSLGEPGDVGEGVGVSGGRGASGGGGSRGRAGVALDDALRGAIRRPDLLLLAALFHDLGKVSGAGSVEGGHSELGAQRVVPVLARIGLAGCEADVVVSLVRHHLLLAELATTADPEDPATAACVAEAVGADRGRLAMLRLLTEADARAAGPQAWTAWRARLVDQLTARALALC